MQNLVEIGSPRRLFGRTLFFVFFAQRPGGKARPTATNKGSKRMFPAKEVLFGVLTMKSNI